MASDTLVNVLQTQNELVTEAAAALPHSFSQCTYSRGALRQAVYLCVTCAVPRGICAACSIACHTEHEQLELFPKRAFRCDCPTRAVPHTCALHTHGQEEENTENAYGQNFQGVFCRCRRPYDATKERETMIQCLACEDWFHESCCNLRERPPSREPTPEPEPESDPEPAVTDADQAANTDQAEEDADDGASDASSSGLPPPLIPAQHYEAFVCGACVARIDTLKRYAGTSGAKIVVRDALTSSWIVIPTEETEIEVDVQEGPASGSKRPRPDSSTEEQDAKRLRTATDEGPAVASPIAPCLAPPPNATAQAIYARLAADASDASFGTGDVFLTPDFRERWCRCSTCLPSLEAHPFLLEDEETYEPPDDPDSGLSLEELGMRALQHLPRDRAIDGIRAFNSMRDDLMSFLRPFAQDGRVVQEGDIEAFFEARRQGDAS